MATISIRELSRNPSRAIDEVLETGRPTIITRHGRPVTAMIAIDQDELEDYVLAHAPEYATSMREADRDLRAGNAKNAAAVFAELDD